MPRPKISPSKLDRDMTRETPEAAAAKPTLKEVLSDISKLSEEEVEARGGSALVKLDQAMRAVVAEHTKTRNAGMPMTAKQMERVVEMTADEDKQGAKAPMLPLPSNVMALPSADRREKLRIVEALLFAASEPLKETELAQHFARRRGRACAARGAARPLCRPRRQPGAHRRQVGLPHRRRSVLPARAPSRRAAPPVARRAGDARHHRLPPARHPRRDRGDQRRVDVEGHDRRAARDRLDQAPRPPPRAGAPGDLRHHGGPSSSISASSRSRIFRVSPSSKGPGFSTPTCRPASPCRPPTMRRTCARTRSRSRTSRSGKARTTTRRRATRRAKRSRPQRPSGHGRTAEVARWGRQSRRPAPCLSS